MRCAGGHDDRDVPDSKRADTMCGTDPRLMVLADDLVEDAPHFLLREGAMRFIVEPRDRPAFGMVSNHPDEDRNAAGTRMGHRAPQAIYGDFLLSDLAKHNGTAPGDRRKDVNLVPVVHIDVSLDKVAVEREAHSPEIALQSRMQLSELDP